MNFSQVSSYHLILPVDVSDVVGVGEVAGVEVAGVAHCTNLVL